MAERSCDRSSSTESQPKFPECSHFRRRNDNHRRCQQCRLSDGLPLCTQDSPCLVCQDWLPEAWMAHAKATAQRNRRKTAAAAKGRKLRWWTIRPRPSSRNQPQVHRNPSPWLPASRRWNGPAPTGRTTAGRGCLNASEDTTKKNVTSLRGISPHAVTAAAATGGRASGPGQVPLVVPARVDVPSPAVSRRRRTPRPSSSSSRHHQHHSSGDRRSLSSSSSWASPDHKSQPSHSERRWESSDRTGGTFVARRDVQLSPAKSKAPEKCTITVVASPARQIHIESAPAVPVPAPVTDGSAGAGPAASGGSATSDGPAARNGTVPGNDPTTDHGSATGNGPATGDGSATGDGPATGDGSATGGGSATGDGPVTVDGLTTIVDTDFDNPADVSMVESSHSSQLRFDDPDDSDGPAPLPAAGGDGSAGQEHPAATPVGGPDVSILTGTSTPPLFPSIPKTINQSTLVDFMSLWTLLQRCLELPSVPDNSISPAVQSSLPVPEHDSTNKRSATPAGSPARPKSPERFLHTPQSSISSLVRRAKEAERQARTPVRPPRKPVRRYRNHRVQESRDSRSRSPLSRSSSVESTARDESPLNFNAVLNMDSKRALSEDEDAEGDSKKISAAQYEIFRQAVTSSKGTYKINPAKIKRAARASLLDLGDTEVPDRVSWLDQPSLQDTMASTARIAQGLKEDEEVVKTTLSETLNDNTSSFKFFTVKQIFPREPYRLKIHWDALYASKPPGDHGFIDNKTPSSYHLSHHVCLDTKELARRSAIYASLADSMVASVIEELSPKDERTKLLREKLTIIQEAQVSAVSAGFAVASNLQLLRRDALLRNFNFQPQFSLQCLQLRLKVTMWLVLNQKSFKVVSGPSDKQIVWQAHQWLSPSRKKSRPARRRHPRRRLLGLPCLTGWAPLHPQRRGRSHRSRPFELAPEGPVHDPSKEARSLANLLLLQPSNVDGSQVGARLADFAPHWRSLLGNCRATGIIEDGVGIAFQQRPQLTHQSISFRTRNSQQDLQQAVDALLMKGAIERVTNVKSLGFYSRLFLVPKKTGDLRPVIDLSTLNRHMVVPHFKMETQGSVRSAIRSQEWTVSIDIRDAYLHVPMHQAVCKYLRFVVNKKVYQFTGLPFGLATSPREFTKLLRPVVSLLRQLLSPGGAGRLAPE